MEVKFCADGRKFVTYSILTIAPVNAPQLKTSSAGMNWDEGGVTPAPPVLEHTIKRLPTEDTRQR